MKLHSIIFSPTRTSAKIAASIASGINEVKACPVTTCDLTSAPQTISLHQDDIAIIAAPVYGGKIAPITKERMSRITADSTPCILVAVYGNRAFENALNDMAAFVRGLGFRPIAAGAFVGEHSYSTEQYPIATGRPDVEDLNVAAEFGRTVGRRMTADALQEIDTTQLHDIAIPEESMKNFINFVMGYQKQQKESPRTYLPELDESLCNGCGTCADVCPTSAIDETHHVDATKCIKCCACVKICPTGARSLKSPFAPVLSANFSARKQPVWAVG